MSKVTFHDLVVKLRELSQELGRTPTLREFVATGISKRQIDKYKYSKIVEAVGLTPNKHAQVTDPVEVIIRPPRILVFDIECTGMIIESYGLYNQNHNHKDIIEDWSLLSYAGYFPLQDEMHYMDNRFSLDYKDDRQVVDGLHHLLSTADIIIGHNSDKFDLKKFNTKAEKYELGDIYDPIKYDTIKMLKAKYALPSNSLDYAARYFDLKERKSSHGKFPGKSLFDECKKGNIEAWEELKLYNKQDCLVTWELFQRLAKHDRRINFNSFYQKSTCSCGGQEFFKNGLKYAKNGAFQIYRCRACSKSFIDKTNLLNKDIRSDFLK
jgi:DNA polymerase elongation subunit (family B)